MKEPDPRHSPKAGDDAGIPDEREVEPALAEPFEHLGRGRGPAALLLESHDDPVEIGDVRPPIVGVADKRVLLAALPAVEEERAVPDRPSRLGVDDPVAPDRCEVLADEGMSGQNRREEAPPACFTRTKDDSERLRVERADGFDTA